MKPIKKLSLSVLAALGTIATVSPLQAADLAGKQGNVVFFFNVIIVLIIVGLGGFIWWKKKQDKE